MTALRRRRLLPATPTGYALAPDASWFSLIVPVARTNLIQNPSFETNTTSWTAIGGSIARSSAEQYHGAYSLAITTTSAMTDGARYDTVSLTSGTTYAYSCKFKGVAGLKYKICIENTSAVEQTSYTFVATGRWQWVAGYYTPTSTTTYRLTVRKAGHASTGVFYIDGAQVESINAGETVSTFISGDEQGYIPREKPAPYQWTGVPHASTSTRSAQTRSGGMVVRLDKYGFVLLALAGLGMATVQDIVAPLGLADGGSYQGTRKERAFSLTGRINEASFANLQRRLDTLSADMDRDRVAFQQPVTLLYQALDECRVPFSDVGRLVCSYQGGLGGATDNLHSEQLPLSFKQYLPYIQSDAEQGAPLTVQQTVASSTALAQRSASGLWATLGGGITGGAGDAVKDIALGQEGVIYICGKFTNIGGGANTRNIGAIVPSAPSAGLALGTGGTAGDTCWRMLVDAQNRLYVFGDFASIGGAATSQKAARYVFATDTWTGLNYPGGGTAIRAAAIGPDGTVYTTDYSNGKVYKYVPSTSTWTLIGTAAGFAGFTAAAVGPDGYLYVGGSFTSIDGVTATNIIRWNPATSTWSALGGTLPFSSAVLGITFGENGELYIASNSAPYIAKWNGAGFTNIGNLTGTSGAVGVSRSILSGAINSYGLFTAANGVTLPDSMAFWNGSTMVPYDIDMVGTPGTTGVNVVVNLPDGRLIVGTDYSAGNATSAAVTTVTNTGSERAYPTLIIRGPTSGSARIYQVTNYTTGRAIYLNYTIVQGETATLVFAPDKLSFTSDFQGDLTSKILPGSSQGDFFLMPGANSISFFSADSTVTATMYWRPCHAHIAGLTP